MATRLGIPKVASFHLDVARIAHHYHLGFVEPVTDVATRVVFNAADVSLAPSKPDSARHGAHRHPQRAPVEARRQRRQLQPALSAVPTCARFSPTATPTTHC